MNEKISEGEHLNKFLGDCEEIIDMLVRDEGRYVRIDFSRRDPTFRSLVGKAWDEARKSLRETMETIGNEHDRYADILHRYGLSGDQLKLKLHVFNAFLRRFRKKGSVIALKRLLAQMDTLLGSLSKAFSQLEQVLEIKETLENLTKAHTVPEELPNEIQPTKRPL